MKYLKWLLAGMIIVVGCSYLFIVSKHPIRSGELHLAGLSETVYVTFDDFGVPHIRAANDEDMYRAFGYIHAQDRLFQMDLIRRLARGRLAEWFGKEALKADTLFRTLQINRFTSQWMKQYLSSAPIKRQNAINAYIAGINQFIQTGKTPLEYSLLATDKELFSTEDMAAVLGFTAFQFTIGMNQDVMVSALANQLTESHLNDLAIRWQPGSVTSPVDNQQAQLLTSHLNQVIDLLTPGGLFIGSNSWVVSGERTESGKPILVNDPHMGFAQPSVWYEAYLNSPESEIYGHHLALIPFALLGHNQHMAWGLTMFLNDDVDLFKERVNPDDPMQYWAIDGWERFETHQEIIQVRGGEPVTLTLKTSRHGPIVNSAYSGFEGYQNSFAEVAKDEPLAMWWLFNHPDNNLIDPLYELSRSNNLQQAESAVAKIYSPGLNVTYADVDNNIAWWAAGRLIKRPAHVNSSVILDGASGNDDPLGFYDFSINPKNINPARGYLLNANNQPADTGIGLIPGYYLGRDRALRIEQLLSENKRWRVEDMKQMLLDNISTSVPHTQQHALTDINRELLNDSQLKYLEILSQWQGNHEVTKIEPTLYYHFKKQLLTEIYADEMGEHYFEMFLDGFLRHKSYWKILESPESVWWDNIHTTKRETKQAIVTQAWISALQKVEQLTDLDLSRLQWKHHLHMMHQHPLGLVDGLAGVFNVGPLEAAGGNETINNMVFKLQNEPFTALLGPSTRRIVDLSDLENSWGINPTGQSGVVTDTHYDDQAIMYAKGQFRPQIITTEQLAKHTRSQLVLHP